MVSQFPLSRRPALGAGSLAAVVLASALTLSACGQRQPRGGGPTSSEPQPLLLVSYAVTKGAYERILPGFIADWKAKTGQTIEVKTSYGASGAQARAVIDGLDADVVGLALAGDVLKIQQAGLIQPGWQEELPNHAMVTNSTVALMTREANPKGIKGWSDLVKPGVKVVTANPKTSGGARWNFLGLWGSVTQTGGSDEQAKAFVAKIYGQVESLPKDAREATDTFLARGQGDVLLNYENEAILAKKKGDFKGTVLVPDLNILIEGPIAVVDKNVDRKGSRKAAEALAAYLQSEPAQQIFAEEGFRPINRSVWEKVKSRFTPLRQTFTVEAFGGWEKVNTTVFGPGGLWDQLFRQAHS